MTEMQTNDTDRLFNAILKLGTVEDCRAFFDDLCTIKEVQDMAQRLKVALLLDQGKNYQEIAHMTGASSTTICRVRKCLMYGSGGYEKIVPLLREKEDA